LEHLAAASIVRFRRANFVAATFLKWLPRLFYEKFSMSLSARRHFPLPWSLSSLAGGRLCGGVLADWRCAD